MTGNKTNVAITERDLQVFREASVLRVFRRDDAARFANFNSVTRTNARLLQLVRAGLLNRFFVATERGGRKCLYTLTAKGALAAQVAFTGVQRKKDSVLIGDQFVEHQLHINLIYLILKYPPTSNSNATFLYWRTFRERISSAAPIIPDAYFEISFNNQPLCCFLEVDLGGESSKIWKTKIESYLRLAVSGEYERRFNRPQFRVLIVANSGKRIRSLRTAVSKHTDKIFRLSTFEDINRDGVWAPVWFRPTDDQKQSL